MAFYAVGTDPYESMDDLITYKRSQGYPWPVAKAPPDMSQRYNVNIQSIKVAIDGTGVIQYRAGYGKTPAGSWHGLFQNLGAQEGQ